MIDATFRPIDQWPGELTPDDARQQSRFKASYTDTLNLLDRELWELNGRNIVIQLALELRDIRYDGWPRASASPQHPGVIVAFDSIHGPLKYATDAFKGNGYGGWLPGWQANLRAVALGLEALRKVDRYGITKRGEQYTGWSALPPGTIAAGAAAMTGEQAAQYIDNACGGLYAREHILRNYETRAAAYRAAAKVLHPDVEGGDTKKFKRLQEAMRVLGGDA